MSLEMKAACEQCDASLGEAEEAYICSYECTFCASCVSAFDHRCPNCGGEFVPRPRRNVDD